MTERSIAMNGKTAVITEADFDKLSGLVRSRQGRATYGPRASALEQELGRGEVVAPMNVAKGVVTMNSRVRIRDLASDEGETFTLVYPHEANIDHGLLSVLAPLGTALLGAKVGDEVEVNAPAGLRRIKVERILYQPEAAGDYHL
jgi:regulator of nucleoside diphosphate kinase